MTKEKPVPTVWLFSEDWTIGFYYSNDEAKEAAHRKYVDDVGDDFPLSEWEWLEGDPGNLSCMGYEIRPIRHGDQF